MIHIYDANNVLRREMEQRMFSNFSQPRGLYIEAATATEPEIYVWDGYNHNARRRELFPGYKIRPPVAEDIYTGLQFLREVLIHTPAIQIEVPEWEADDVIGTLARDLARKGHKVMVHSNDLDYFQLRDTPGISLNGVNNKTGAPAIYLPLYKALVGDASDKIPGIPLFGPKAFLDLEPKWRQMKEALDCQDVKYLWDKCIFKKSCNAWLRENEDLLLAYYKIVHLWPVDQELIDKHTYPGIPNDAGAQALLQKYML